MKHYLCLKYQLVFDQIVFSEYERSSYKFCKIFLYIMSNCNRYVKYFI